MLYKPVNFHVKMLFQTTAAMLDISICFFLAGAFFLAHTVLTIMPDVFSKYRSKTHSLAKKKYL
jgi:hypothetical protein